MKSTSCELMNFELVGMQDVVSYLLSYKGPTFSAILQNLLEPFFRNVPKTAILAKIGHFFER